MKFVDCRQPQQEILLRLAVEIIASFPLRSNYGTRLFAHPLFEHQLVKLGRRA
jgi:hypothetical protein